MRAARTAIDSRNTDHWYVGTFAAVLARDAIAISLMGRGLHMRTLSRQDAEEEEDDIHIPLVVMLLRPLRLEAEISSARGINTVRSSRPRRPRIIAVSLLLFLFLSRINRRRISRMVRAAPSELWPSIACESHALLLPRIVV